MKYNVFFQILFVVCFSGGIMFPLEAQEFVTSFRFTETASDYTREAMQRNAYAVFSEINRAYEAQETALNLSFKNATAEAINRLQSMWATSHFYSTETSVIERVLKTPTGYQIRNVSAYFEEGRTEEDKIQELVIEFDESGKITDVFMSIMAHQYVKILSNHTEIVEDFESRSMILRVIEEFRTAYNTKDIDFLRKIYSDDALIITGKVLTYQQRRDVVGYKDKRDRRIEYSVRSKKEYLRKLQDVFNNNAYINIKFSDINITASEGYKGVYGVNLRQDWNTRPNKNSVAGYHDEGWLFLLFDFRDENNPKIWVRTWQPLQDEWGNPIHYSAREIFGMGDFNFR